jgi:Lrp/AsnC family transcriptional regulator, leucine-responsive regulatory protein
MNQIDSIDERILAQLQANGRLTMKALAEVVGLSSPAMIERVRRLEDRGIIAGYRAIVAPNALGRPIAALIAAEVNRPDFNGFLERVQNDPAIAECHRTTGEATFLLRVNVADTAALEELIDDLGATGAHCVASLILSSPVAWREVTPPAGVTQQRSRLNRRRRRGGANANDSKGDDSAARVRRPGRPRTRKATG